MGVEDFYQTFLQVFPCFSSWIISSYLFKTMEMKGVDARIINLLDHTISILPFILLCFNFSYVIQNSVFYISIIVVILNNIFIFCCNYYRRKSSENNSDPRPNSEYSKVLIDTQKVVPENRIKNVTVLYDKCKAHNRELASFRGLTYLLTVICILAVDLPAFEPSLHKSGYRGTGLMDVGVGLFVMHMGVKSIGQKWLSFTYDQKRKSLLNIVKVSLMLFGLGIIRLILLTMFNMSYAYLEYGIHSNVFIVLGVVRILGSTVDILTVNRIKPGYVALFIIVIYEILLKYKLYSITAFSSTDDRKDMNIFMANIESIVSFIGHTALYLFAKQLADIFYASQTKDYVRQSYVMIISGLLISFINQILIYYVDVIASESRRLCNWSYIVWLVTFFLTTGGIRKLYTGYCKDNNLDDLRYEEKVDQMGFLYFIIANLIVGVVRLLKQIVKFSYWSGPVIVYFYCSLTFILSYYFQFFIKKVI